MTLSFIEKAARNVARRYPVQQVDFGITDSIAKDAFNRLRTSNPDTLFESTQQYNKQHLLWDEKTVGTASSTHVPDESATKMTVGSAQNDSIIRQTFEYFHYQPGKSQHILLTSVLPSKTGVRARIGYFDDENGIYFECADGIPAFTVRSMSTGVLTEDKVVRNAWNYDKMDGSGSTDNPSTLNFDDTEGVLVWIDLEWLSLGRVRVGFFKGGIPWKVHDFIHEDIADRPYMTTANLPVRYEITNTAATSGSTDLMHICSTVISEGGFTVPGVPGSISNETTPVSVTTARPILSIRPKATFNSITNRINAVIEDLSIYSADQPVHVQVVYDGVLTGAVWADTHADNSLEHDVTATAITGGLPIKDFYIAASGLGSSVGNTGAARALDILSELPLALDIDGANPKLVSLVVTSLATATDCYGTFEWRDIY